MASELMEEITVRAHLLLESNRSRCKGSNVLEMLISRKEKKVVLSTKIVVTHIQGPSEAPKKRKAIRTMSSQTKRSKAVITSGEKKPSNLQKAMEKAAQVEDSPLVEASSHEEHMQIIPKGSARVATKEVSHTSQGEPTGSNSCAASSSHTPEAALKVTKDLFKPNWSIKDGELINSAVAAADYLFHCIPKVELNCFRSQDRVETDGAFMHGQVHYLFRLVEMFRRSILDWDALRTSEQQLVSTRNQLQKEHLDLVLVEGERDNLKEEVVALKAQLEKSEKEKT